MADTQTPAPAVPMTADVEAVAREIAAHGVYPEQIAAILARHWPQPVSGQLTGREWYEAVCRYNGMTPDWSQVHEQRQREYNGYAEELNARLAAPQGVGTRFVSNKADCDYWKPIQHGGIALPCNCPHNCDGQHAAPQGVGVDVEAVASRRLTAWEKYIGQRAWDASREQAHDTTFREWLTMNHPNDQHMIPNEEVVASCRDGMRHADAVAAQGEAAAVQVGMSAYKTGFRDGEKAAQKAMDADALAQEIMAYVYPPSGDLPATKANIAAILRRHTPSVSAGREVVEVHTMAALRQVWGGHQPYTPAQWAGLEQLIARCVVTEEASRGE